MYVENDTRKYRNALIAALISIPAFLYAGALAFPLAYAMEWGDIDFFRETALACLPLLYPTFGGVVLAVVDRFRAKDEEQSEPTAA